MPKLQPKQPTLRPSDLLGTAKRVEVAPTLHRTTELLSPDIRHVVTLDWHEIIGRRVVAKASHKEGQVLWKVTIEDATRNLFFGASLLEHSCNPNAFVFVHGREASVIAQVPISIGEPVSVSYIDAFAPITIRRQLLSAKFSFQCCCPVCTDSVDRARAFHCGFCGGMVYGRSDCATGYTNCMSCGAQQDTFD
ncbi:hypothetical protein FOZ63_002993, partial [Perkinsus olseni]